MKQVIAVSKTRPKFRIQFPIPWNGCVQCVMDNGHVPVFYLLEDWEDPGLADDHVCPLDLQRRGWHRSSLVKTPDLHYGQEVGTLAGALQHLPLGKGPLLEPQLALIRGIYRPDIDLFCWDLHAFQFGCTQEHSSPVDLLPGPRSQPYCCWSRPPSLYPRPLRAGRGTCNCVHIPTHP